MNLSSKIWVSIAASLLSASVQAGLWMTGNNGDLFHLESETGPITTIGNTGISGTEALTLDASGTIYVTNNSSLFTVNRTTAVATTVGSFGGTTGIEGLAFDLGGTLYGANAGALFTINTATGFATFASALTNDYDDLAVARTDIAYSGGTITAGTLLGLDADNGIYTINTSTFAEALVEAIPLDVGDEAMATDEAGGILTHNFNREPGGLGGLYDVDLSIASADTLIITTSAGITGMYLENDTDVPVPGTAWLFGGMLAGMVARRRRRKV